MYNNTDPTPSPSPTWEGSGYRLVRRVLPSLQRAEGSGYRLLFYGIICALMLLTACMGSSHRSEIEQRKAALRHKQDSTLLASQQELALVDSALEATKVEYERLKAEVEQHKEALQATAEELTALTMLRMKRDSLQVQWDVLGAKIKYIRKKMEES